MVEITRGGWILIGLSIALFAVSAGVAELATAYDDLYELGRCSDYTGENGRPNSSLATCKSTRLAAAAAHMGATATKVPAIGLLLAAIAVTILQGTTRRVDESACETPTMPASTTGKINS